MPSSPDWKKRKHFNKIRAKMARKGIAGSWKLETFAKSLPLLRNFAGFAPWGKRGTYCPMHSRAANGATGAIFLNILAICWRAPWR